MPKIVTQEKEKRSKSKTKVGGETQESTITAQESPSNGVMKATKHIQFSEKEDAAKIEKRHKRDKENKKRKQTRDADVGMEKGAKECQSTNTEDRKRKKRENNKKKNDRSEMGNAEEVEGLEGDIENDRGKISGKEQRGDASEKADRKKKQQNKKKIRKENDEENLFLLHGKNVTENMVLNMHSTKHDGNASNKLGKKKHKKQKNSMDVSSVGRQDISTQDSVDGFLHTEEMTNKVESAIEGRKKKAEVMENGSDEIQDKEVKKSKRMEKKAKLAENSLNDTTPNKSNKKVRFSGEVEIFSLPDDSNTEMLGNGEEEDNLVRGKRFTSDEDKIIKDSVFKYIEKYHLGDEGLDMVLNSKKHSKLKGCWKEIGSALPHRPYTATYYRAQIIFRRAESRNWSKEELELILNYQKEHGNEWKALADELGRHRWHVKDAYRRNKLENLKRGHWTQNEYQTLFDLVNTDLLLKVNEEKRSKHGMLRDNICWTAISDKLSTRNQSKCCEKWYNQLTSPMVAEGIWADTDDYRLLGVLYSLDATCMEDVDWDCLLDNRSGDLCRKRWNQMLLHIGHHGNKSFAEQVEVLAERYCPNLLEAREAWDSKPRVP